MSDVYATEVPEGDKKESSAEKRSENKMAETSEIL